MSIKMTRNFKAMIADSKNFFWNFNATTRTIISFSHLKHIKAIWFLKSQIWKKQFTHLSKKFSGKFDAIKIASRWFFSIDYFNTSKSVVKLINKTFRDALDLQFQHVLGQSCFCRFNSFANEKAAITINKTGEINKIVDRDLVEIQSCSSLTHKMISYFVTHTSSIQNAGFIVHRERLNEKNAEMRMRKSALIGNYERGIRRVSPA